ncbi:MAG: hypothetical protein LBC70_04265 [Chitinispirillales bacterium]|jgi:hypothetical protein|nr:hypothetical protein [Chitinispirillales bacterium]
MTKYAKVLVVVTMFFGGGIVSDAMAQSRSIIMESDTIILHGPWAESFMLLQTRRLRFNAFNAPASYGTFHYGNFIVSGGNQGGHFGLLVGDRIYAYEFIHSYGAITSPLGKGFIHPHPTEPSVIRYVAIESGQALTVTRGVAQTVNGQVTIPLPEHFAMVTSEIEPLTVTLTPMGAPALIYIKEVSRERITVAMKPSDFSEYRDIEFSYHVTGVRDGFEKQEIIVADDRQSEITIREDVQKRIDAYIERDRARLGVEDHIMD